MSADRLTKTQDRRPEARSPAPSTSHWDADLKGFGVRVSPAGAKTFILKYRLDSGRVRWKTLGRVGTMALEKARGRQGRHRHRRPRAAIR